MKIIACSKLLVASLFAINPMLDSAGPLHLPASSFFERASYKEVAPAEMELPGLTELGLHPQILKRTFDLPTQDDVQRAEHEALEIEYPTLESLTPFTNYGLQVRLGQLTEPQFNQLKTFYRVSKEMQFDESRVYELIDFLPPSAQATADHFFIQHRETITKTSYEGRFRWLWKLLPHPNIGEISSVSNCWNVVWEYLRGSKSSLSTFFVSEEKMQSALEDSRFSEPVTTVAGADLKALFEGTTNSALQKISASDVFLIYQKVIKGGHKAEVLAHVLVYLGDGLVFEKSNPGSDYPPRIAFLKDSLANLMEPDQPQGKELKKLKISVRRFNQAPLPHAKELFSMAVSSQEYLNPQELPKKQQPPPELLKDYTAVPEEGMGGGLLGEFVYKIIDHPMEKNPQTDRFELNVRNGGF